MSYRIEIQDKKGVFDAVGEGIKKDIQDLGIKSVRGVRFIQVYNIEGNLSEDQIKKICEELLVDKISQDYNLTTNPACPCLAGRRAAGRDQRPARD